MQLGVNNLREHAGLDSYYATCHGLENGLANVVEATPASKRKPVYLIKTGQGGSVIAQWQPTASTGYWETLRKRIEAGRRQLPANPQWVVWLSLGINDGIAGTSVVTWKQDTLVLVQRLKMELPGSVIIMTQFQAMKAYPQIDSAIREISAQEPNVYAVDSTGTSLRDANHWDYAGLNSMAQKMSVATKKALDAQATHR